MEIKNLKITDAYVQHLNGYDTAKKVILEVNYIGDDSDGSYYSRKQISLPVSFNTPIGEHPELIETLISINFSLD